MGIKRSKNVIGLLLLLPSIAFAQNVAKHLNRRDSVYTIVEHQPEFPGGMAAIGQYLSKAIRQAPGSGSVFVSFVVGKSGYLRDVKVSYRNEGTGNSDFEKKIAHTIRNMPRWKPGQHKGKAVSVRYNLPITLEPE